jgi:hypothetical protein
VSGTFSSAPARHLIFLVKPTNPLLVFSSSIEDTSIPLSILFTILAIAIHVNLSLLLYPERSTLAEISLLSYRPLFALSAVSPCLGLLLGRGWLTVAWWSVSGMVVCLAYSVQRWIDKENQSLTELEELKYVAPGA